MFYSYDSKTGYLFSATNNYNFKFEGTHSAKEIKEKFLFIPKPEQRLYAWGNNECLCVQEELASWVGSMFMSLTADKSCVCIDVKDGNKRCAFVANARNVKLNTFIPFKYDEKFIHKGNYYICLTGDILNKPVELAAIGRTFNTHRFFVPEIQSGIYGVGALALILAKHSAVDIKPHRPFFTAHNMDDLVFSAQDFDKNLAHDASGKMAHLVASNVSIINEICKPIHSCFYGRAVVKPSANDTGIYFVHEAWVHEFFNEPKSIIDYIARYVPVEMAGNDKFKEQIQNNAATVPVRIINRNDDEMLAAFCRFYEMFSKKKVFLTKHPMSENWHEKVPIFRYNKGYMAPKSFINERYKDKQGAL